MRHEKKKIAPPRGVRMDMTEVPKWIEESKELWYRGKLVKKFRRPAKNAFAILRDFEAKGWPRWIADPLPNDPEIVPKERLHTALKKLNRGQKKIHFGGDGTGSGVIWAPHEEFRGKKISGPRWALAARVHFSHVQRDQQ